MEIPDDAFAPSLSEMDGVHGGNGFQQHLGMGCGDASKALELHGTKVTWLVQCQVDSID